MYKNGNEAFQEAWWFYQEKKKKKKEVYMVIEGRVMGEEREN